MLKNIPPLLGPDLLHALAAMGHGDTIAIVDRNFPATSNARRLISLPGTNLDEVFEAVLTVLPVDTFVEPAVWRMGPVGDESQMLPVHTAIQTALDDAEGRAVTMGTLDRFEFYRRASEAFAIVSTTDDRPYGCFLVVKGVV